MKDILATWITREIEERGWSQRELARRAKVSNTTISKVLSGAIQPTYNFCAAIAGPLGKTPYEIFLIGELIKPGLENKAKQGKPVSGHSAMHDLPSIPPIPDDKHIMELFERLDTFRKRQIYDFARWILMEQEDSLNSKQVDKVKQEESSAAIKNIELLLAVNEADPEVIEQVINRLQKILREQKEKLPQQAETDPI